MDTRLSSSPSLFSISPEQLAARMGQADAPLLLDVRREASFQKSERIIAGTLRCAPEDLAAFTVTQLVQDLAREIVVHCVFGHNVSADAAAGLRTAGLNARVLAGGFESGENGVDTLANIAAWRGHALPTAPKDGS